MRRALLVPFLLCALAASGCPRTPDAPDPGGGMPCDQLDDCNPGGVTCGALTLCVAGFCEEGASLIRPCPGEGEPIVDPGP